MSYYELVSYSIHKPNRQTRARVKQMYIDSLAKQGLSVEGDIKELLYRCFGQSTLLWGLGYYSETNQGGHNGYLRKLYQDV